MRRHPAPPSRPRAPAGRDPSRHRRRALAALAALATAALTAAAPLALAAPAAAQDREVSTRGATWSVAGWGSFSYGRPGDEQVMGDWDGDGVATPGVVRGGVWYLRNSRSAGSADVVLAFGRAGDRPVVGDWDGDGRTGVGVVRGTTWHLRNALTSGPAEVSFVYGRAGDAPVTGDWDGDRRTGIGVVRGSTWHLRQTGSGGTAQITFDYGRVGDLPVTGDWDGDRRAGVGVVRGTTWHLRNSLSGGAAQRTTTFGACGDGVLSTAAARVSPGVPTTLRGTEWTTLPTSQRVVALTFDAGANAAGVPSILTTLRATGTPATFFLTGSWVRAYPAAARDIASGFPVGNHTVSHPDLTTLSDAAVRDQVVQADLTIRTTTGRDPRPWFRFPFGARDGRTIGVVNCAGYGSVRWTVDTLGWQGTSGGRSVPSVVTRVLDTLRPGQIVLMHVGSHPTDGSTLDADALPIIIRELRDRGYTFVTLDAFR